MSPIDRASLRGDLTRDEGVRLRLYQDTVGKWTIGCGRNLSDNGISQQEALLLLEHDIENAERDARKACPKYETLSGTRQRALCNMSFNLGLTRLLRFRKMLTAIADADFETAATEALKSRWATQVGQRAVRIAALIRAG